MPTPFNVRSLLSHIGALLLTTLVVQGCGSMPAKHVEHEQQALYQAKTQARLMQAKRMKAPPRPSASMHAIASPLKRTDNSQEQYESTPTNPIKQVVNDPVSTFSVDVDSASYTNIRRMLRRGQQVPAQAVRVEEIVNYFSYNDPVPQSPEIPLAIQAQSMPTPWNPHTRLMRIGIQGYELPIADRPTANLVFLLDISGSMGAQNKLELVKKSFRYLVQHLRTEDRVSIVTYSDETSIALPPTAGHKRTEIMQVVNQLQADGSTNGSAGLRMAYDLAREHFKADQLNRILLATDGDFNFGQTNHETLEQQVARERKSGIYLSVLGYGEGNLNDALMQKLAQAGNGIAYYVDSLLEANKIFSQQLFSTLFPIANDVKIQVEFNPAHVAEYRLIGYETRMLKREDFTNDQVDAGEIGSGHSVTALYEYAPIGQSFQHVYPLRYATQKTAKTRKAQATPQEVRHETAFIRVRYKRPGHTESQELTRAVTMQDHHTTVEGAPEDLRFAAAVAGFAQRLKDSPHLKNYDYAPITKLLRHARGADPFGYRSELLQLIPLANK
ncbi:vWA domain-containing protein [Magnetococcus sp. PR-3]|uniref:vWA domain-containing protein n=1 Tax=Magnetococcus sp. PR-3 TaxID=3120355 RepID=UPI002FCE4EFE